MHGRWPGVFGLGIGTQRPGTQKLVRKIGAQGMDRFQMHRAPCAAAESAQGTQAAPGWHRAGTVQLAWQLVAHLVKTLPEP